MGTCHSGQPDALQHDDDKLGQSRRIWNGEDSARPIVSVYVKPCRYTHDFIEKNEIFTVTFFDKKYKPDLGILGRESGRDGDKVAKTSLTPIAVGGSVGFREADTNNSLQKNI